jgi:hypothetical protein
MRRLSDVQECEEIRRLWRREYTKKSGNRIVVSTRKNICKKSA